MYVAYSFYALEKAIADIVANKLSIRESIIKHSENNYKIK